MTRAADVPCDYCTHRAAVLICRADSAKLCLVCDHHVHSANALSQKHQRSQICDNCSAEPASVRCATDGLVLCHDCDWAAHGADSSSSHQRVHVEGFAGCPSAEELGAGWGFGDLGGGKADLDLDPGLEWGFGGEEEGYDAWMFKTTTLQDLMVPGERYESVGRREEGGGGNCGKRKSVIYRQLVELMKSGSGEDGEGDVEGEENAAGELVVENSEGLSGRRYGFGGGEGGEGFGRQWSAEEEQRQQLGSFTSLLMPPAQQQDVKEGVERNVKGQSTQVSFEL